MAKIQLEKTIKADRQYVFDILANYENFEKILPQYFPSIRVRSVRESTAVVEEHFVFGGKELIMMTKHVTKYPELHETFVIGGDAKGSHIVEEYEKIPDGTKLKINADLKLKGTLRIAGMLDKKKIISEYDKIVDAFAQIAEKT